MAKLTKKALKQLIKECLVEILVEGIGDEGDILEESLSHNALKTNKKLNNSAYKQKMKKIQKQRDELDRIRVNTTTKKEDFSSLTGDSVMQSIFADTAKTTLVEQVESKHGASGPVGGNDTYARIANENDPMELFDGAGRWESLAFMNKKPS